MDYLLWLLSVLGFNPPKPKAEPPPVVVVKEKPSFWAAPPTDNAIINMHWGRPDGVRLFSRSATWEFQHAEIVDKYAAFLSDPVFRIVWATGAKNAVLQHDFWVLRYDAVKKEYLSKPSNPLRDVDVDVITWWLGKDHNKFIIDDGAIGGFALALPCGDIQVGSSTLTGGLPDRSTFLHEATHHIQWRLKERSYARNWDYNVYNTPELGAMIIENCARISEGWDVSDFVDMDNGQHPAAEEPYAKTLFSFPAPRPPAMHAALAYQYYVKYGPHFTGDLAKDLIKLQEWVPRFEKIGILSFDRTDKDWINEARCEERARLMDPLCSTCQTWLAINGQASIYDKVISKCAQDLIVPDAPLTEAFAKAIPDWDKVPVDNQKAALDFIKRCNGTP